MYLDKELELSDAQAVTADAASTNVIDTSVSGGRAYDDLWLVVQVQTTFDSAGDAGTLNVKVQTDDAEDFSSATELHATGILAQSALTAGAMLIKARLSSLGTIKRYLRVYYDNGTAEFSAGKIDAFLTPDVPFGH